MTYQVCNKEPLTAIKPALDALACHFKCSFTIWFNKVLVLISFCLASSRKLFKVSKSNLKVVHSLLLTPIAGFICNISPRYANGQLSLQNNNSRMAVCLVHVYFRSYSLANIAPSTEY